MHRKWMVEIDSCDEIDATDYLYIDATVCVDKMIQQAGRQAGSRAVWYGCPNEYAFRPIICIGVLKNISHSRCNGSLS